MSTEMLIEDGGEGDAITTKESHSCGGRVAHTITRVNGGFPPQGSIPPNVIIHVISRDLHFLHGDELDEFWKDTIATIRSFHEVVEGVARVRVDGQDQGIAFSL